MKIGYARVSKAHGTQALDMQMDHLQKEGVAIENIYTDNVSGSIDNRPGLAACLKALRAGDTLVYETKNSIGE